MEICACRSPSALMGDCFKCWYSSVINARVPSSLTDHRDAIADFTPACTANPAKPNSASSSPKAVLQALNTNNSTAGLLQPKSRN